MSDETELPRVVRLCSELVKIDSSNDGSGGPAGEDEVATYIAAQLAPLGYEPVVAESAPRRANLMLRVPGADRSLPALLVHGHLDVVPVEADQWSEDPFSGAVHDGYVWGRGASDMKCSIASMLEVLLSWKEGAVRPRRDIVFLFLADEEADAQFGSDWLVDHRPEWFTGVAAAIGEGGGLPVDFALADGRPGRIYPVAAAERGTQHLRVTARGVSGHGSTSDADNAVAHLVDALSRVIHHAWPWQPSPAGLAFLRGAADAMGIEVDLSSPSGVEAAIAGLDESLSAFVRSASRCSTNPTVLRAGYKVNVIPGEATAEIDVRTVPGSEQECLRVLDELLGERISRAFITDSPGISSSMDSPWFEAIVAALKRHDPDARVLPFCLGGGTDAKAFARLGIQCYGFAPLGPNPDGPIEEGEHGVDERVAIVSLIEGTAVLEEFLRTV